MSANIDNRVVQMEFDNAQFEKGVQQTITSLQNLDRSLNIKDTATKGLAGISAAVNGVDFSPMMSGLTALEAHASSVFASIMNAVSQIGGMLGNFGMDLMSKAAGQIVTGGTARAANIEQARFQLKGLGVEWKDVVDDLNYGVKDTPYGLDSAAKAAAQFIASGVSLGEDLKTSLRGISGVAAMTNSDFDSIAHIFTAVAGQGRVMTIQLRQLELRGLNAAAQLAKYFNTTEDAVRDMVASGQVDFKAFSEAMDDAFGEHAKKANETFSGALSNMKAALSRIGADFIMPWREAERQVFLGITHIVDNIRAGFNQSIHYYQNEAMDATGIMSDKYYSLIDMFTWDITEAGKYLMQFLDTVAKSDLFKNIVTSVVMPLDAISHGIYMFSKNVFQVLSNLVERMPTGFLLGKFDQFGRDLLQFGELLNYIFGYVTVMAGHTIAAIYNVVKFILSILQPIVVGIMSAFKGPFNSFYSGSIEFVRALNMNVFAPLEKLTKKLKLPEDTLEKLTEAFSSLGGAISQFVSIISGALFDAIKTIFGSFSLENVTGGITNIGELIAGILVPVANALAGALSYLGPILSGIITSIKDLIVTFVNTSGIGDTVVGIFNSIKDTASSIDLSGITGFIDTLKNGSVDLNEFGTAAMFFGNELIKFLGKFGGTAFESVKSFIDNFDPSSFSLSGVKDFFTSLFENFKGLETIKELILKLKSAFLGLDGAAEAVSGNTKKLAENVDKAVFPFRSMAGAFNNLAGPITEVKQGIDPLKAVLVGLSGVVTGFIVGGGMILLRWLSRLVETLRGTLNLSPALSGMIIKIGKAFTQFGKAAVTKAYADLILSIAIAIGVLAASCIALTFVDPNKLFGAFLIITGFLTFLGVTGYALIKTLEKIDAKKIAAMGSSFAGLGVAFLGIAGSILMLTGAVAILANMDEGAMWRGVMAVGSLVAVITVLGMALSTMKDSQRAILSFSVTLLALGIAMGPLIAAITAFALMPMEVLLKGGISLIVTIFAIFGAFRLAGSINLSGVAITMLTLTATIFAFVYAMNALSQINEDSLSVAKNALSGFMVVILGMLAISSGTDLKGVAPVVLALVALIYIITEGLERLSAINWQSLLIAVGAMSVVIFSLVGAVAVISRLASTVKAVAAAKMMSTLSKAMAMIAASIYVVGQLKIEQVGVALAALAGSLLIMGVAAVVMSPVIPILNALGVAVLLLGQGLLTTGLGMLAFAAGAVLLGTVSLASFELIGQALEILMEHIGNAVVIISTKIAEAIVAFSQAIASHAGEIIQSAALIGGCIIEGIGISLPGLVGTGVRAIMMLAAGILAAVPDLVSMAAWAALNFVVGLGKAISDVAPYVGEAVMSLVNMIGAVLLEGLAGILELSPLTAGLAGDIRNHAADLRAAAAESAAAIEAGYSERFPEMEKEAEQTSDGIASAFDNLPGKLSGVGDSIGGSLGPDIINSLNLDDGVKEELLSIVDNPEAAQAMEALGVDLNESVGEGITDSDGMETALSDATEGAAETAASIDTAAIAEPAGNRFTEGFARGITATANRAEAAAAYVTRLALHTVDVTQDSNSPSKKTAKSGTWFGQGLANGILGTAHIIGNAASSVVGEALDKTAGLKTILSDSLSNIDIDTSPVIRPVLDLSDVRFGVDEMNRLLTAGQPVGLSNVQAFAGSRYGLYGYGMQPQYATSSDTYYQLYINDALINDTPEIRRVVLDTFNTVARYGGMNHG